MAGKSKPRGAEHNQEHAYDAIEQRSTFQSRDLGGAAVNKCIEVGNDNSCDIEEDKDPIRQNVLDVPMVNNGPATAIDMEVVGRLNEECELGSKFYAAKKEYQSGGDCVKKSTESQDRNEESDSGKRDNSGVGDVSVNTCTEMHIWEEEMIEQRESTKSCSTGQLDIGIQMDNNVCTDIEKAKKSIGRMVLEKFLFVGILMCVTVIFLS